MTEQEKTILMQDLCSRLPYGLKVKVCDSDLIHTVVGIDLEKGLLRVVSKNIYSHVPFDHCIPYLRLMSSMTKEECEECMPLFDVMDDNYIPHEEWSYRAFDWFNSHHFDYRGLIGKGLALEAPEGMYNI